MTLGFEQYECDEYFNSSYANGFYHDESYLQLIYPEKELKEKKEIGFLVVGSAGADGIEFGYKKGEKGIWVYYPIDNKFEYVADSLEALIEGWCSGEIKV